MTKPLSLSLMLLLLTTAYLNADMQKRGGIQKCDRDRIEDRTNCSGETTCTRVMGDHPGQNDNGQGKKDDQNPGTDILTSYGNGPGPCTNATCTNACLNAQIRIRSRLRNQIHITGSMCLSNCWENQHQARMSLHLGPTAVCSNAPVLRIRRRTAVCSDPETGGKVIMSGSTNGMVRLWFRHRYAAEQQTGMKNGSNLMHKVQCRFGSWYGETEATPVQERLRKRTAQNIPAE